MRDKNAQGVADTGHQSKSYSTASEASCFQSGIAALDVGYPVFWGSLPPLPHLQKETHHLWLESSCLAFLVDPYLYTHHHPENLMHILGPNAGKQLNFATKKNQGKFVGKNQQTFRDSPCHSTTQPPYQLPISPASAQPGASRVSSGSRVTSISVGILELWETRVLIRNENSQKMDMVFSNGYMWVFPKIGIPQNGWFTMENLIKMDDLGGKPHYFRKHPHVLVPSNLRKQISLGLKQNSKKSPF